MPYTKELRAIVQALQADTSAGAVLATLVGVAGSSYRRPGARLLLLANDRRVGSVSGGCLEEDLLMRARRVAASGKPELVVYDTSSENDLVWGVGLGCHGVVHVLIERLVPGAPWVAALEAAFDERRKLTLEVVYAVSDQPLGTRLGRPGAPARPGVFLQEIAPPPMLHIFGAGDDAIPLAQFAHELGWMVAVADPRPAYASRSRFPTAGRLVHGPIETLLAQETLSTGALAVIMTHHYVHDLPLLRALLHRPLAYLGLLGPRQRAERLLLDAGFGQSAPPLHFHAPVGLDLGADGAEQVALAIIAEIQAVLAGRDARPLRARTRPIHA